MRIGITVIGFLIIISVLAGCTGTSSNSTYSVDDKGVLSLTCAPVTTTEEVLFSNETYTKSRIVFHTENGDVVSLSGSAKTAEGCNRVRTGYGEKLAGHESG